MKYMRKNIFISAVAILFICVESYAQSMTYNHDASKQGQIQVMELGAGNLTPELYYTVTHRSYKNGAKAATSVKNTLRIAANTASIPQVEYADSIQADLEGRAKVEAANIADRQVDLAWVTEGNKIESKLLAFKNNINALNGKAQTEEITNWTELGQMYDFAIKATRQAYMPNSERQKQYLAIYDEIVKSNDHLLLRVRYLTTKNQADHLVQAMSRFQHRVSENATAGYNRWRDASHEGSTRRVSNNP
jgi:hypothetical protein